MTNPQVELDPAVFNPVYLPYLEDMTETQIFFGGASSGKSYFLAERVVYDLMKGQRNYLVCRKVGKYVMKSVWVEVENVINSWGVRKLFKFNKSDRTMTCITKKQVIFTGLDEPQKLKSIRAKDGPITDIWVEEATETDPGDIKELEKRQRGGDESIPKRLTLSFNPILRNHWIFFRYFADTGWAEGQTKHKTDKLTILKTIYKDNGFLTRQDIDRLLSETDKYYRDVYTLGEWGVLGNVIFTNWKIQDLTDMHDQFTNRRNGLDFGFSTDPAAVGVSHYDKKNKTIYFFKELYETGLTNDILADRVKSLIGIWTKDKDGNELCAGTERIICDSAEPKSIAELRRYGVDAVGAKKGKDSVVHGIQWLQQQTIVVDKSCINMQSELQVAKWKEDANGIVVKSGGLPVPVDRNNHLIDGGLRYAYEDDMLDIGDMEVVENPFYA
jgi:phage terminase large subunit